MVDESALAPLRHVNSKANEAMLMFCLSISYSYFVALEPGSEMHLTGIFMPQIYTKLPLIHTHIMFIYIYRIIYTDKKKTFEKKK